MKHLSGRLIPLILGLWLCMFLTDVLCAFLLGRPIFMLAQIGGCNTVYWGLGYTITHFYNMTPSGVVSESVQVAPYLYLVANFAAGIWFFSNQRKGQDS